MLKLKRDQKKQGTRRAEEGATPPVTTAFVKNVAEGKTFSTS